MGLLHLSDFAKPGENLQGYPYGCKSYTVSVLLNKSFPGDVRFYFSDYNFLTGKRVRAIVYEVVQPSNPRIGLKKFYYQGVNYSTQVMAEANYLQLTIADQTGNDVISNLPCMDLVIVDPYTPLTKHGLEMKRFDIIPDMMNSYVNFCDPTYQVTNALAVFTFYYE